MSGTAIALLVVGVLLNLGGIVLVRWQDVAPSKFGRAVSRGREVYRRLINRLLRMLGRPPRGRVLKASATLSLKMASRISGVKSLGDGATLEEKVAYLLRGDREAQEADNALAGRIEDLERDTVKRFDDAWAEMERYHEEKATEALNLHRGHRIWSSILLVAGLLCLVAAKFV